MKRGIKHFAREVLNRLHIDLTRNLKYDRLTRRIMQMVLKDGVNCIDVGCHKGEILEKILALSPSGNHFAFEPIPDMYKSLLDSYGRSVSVFPFALSDHEGQTTFQYVRNAPAYSGIKKRKYPIGNPDIVEIPVELRRLDDVIPETLKIGFIKIDVEGGEFSVLKGATRILREHQPVVIFESGLGASEYYGTKPEELYSFLSETVHMQISLLRAFVKGSGTLTKDQFVDCYNTNSDYYFVATGKDSKFWQG